MKALWNRECLLVLFGMAWCAGWNAMAMREYLRPPLPPVQLSFAESESVCADFRSDSQISIPLKVSRPVDHEIRCWVKLLDSPTYLSHPPEALVVIPATTESVPLLIFGKKARTIKQGYSEILRLEMVDIYGAQPGKTIEHTLKLTRLPIVRERRRVTLSLSRPSVEESPSAFVSLTADLDQPAEEDILIACRYEGSAVASQDYVPVRELQISKGTTQGTCRIQIRTDDIRESTEKVVIRFSSFSDCVFSPETLNFDIHDNYQQFVTIESPTIAELPESNESIIQVNASIEKPASEDIVLDVLISGTAEEDDFIRPETRFVIPKGATEASWALGVRDDTLPEEDEKLRLAFSTRAGDYEIVGNALEFTITDNDPICVVAEASAPSVTEGESITLAAISEHPVPRDVRIELTPLESSEKNVATMDEDFQFVGDRAIVIVQGTTRGEITIDTIDDDFGEPTEIVALIPGLPDGVRCSSPSPVLRFSIEDNDSTREAIIIFLKTRELADTSVQKTVGAAIKPYRDRLIGGRPRLVGSDADTADAWTEFFNADEPDVIDHGKTFIADAINAGLADAKRQLSDLSGEKPKVLIIWASDTSPTYRAKQDGIQIVNDDLELPTPDEMDLYLYWLDRDDATEEQVEWLRSPLEEKGFSFRRDVFYFSRVRVVSPETLGEDIDAVLGPRQ